MVGNKERVSKAQGAQGATRRPGRPRKDEQASNQAKTNVIEAAKHAARMTRKAIKLLKNA